MTHLIAIQFETLAFIFPGHMELIVLAVFGLLIFGRRLPEVGRNVGRSIVEFKKGIKGIEDEIEVESSQPKRTEHLESSTSERIDDAQPQSSEAKDEFVSPKSEQPES